MDKASNFKELFEQLVLYYRFKSTIQLEYTVSSMSSSFVNPVIYTAALTKFYCAFNLDIEICYITQAGTLTVVPKIVIITVHIYLTAELY